MVKMNVKRPLAWLAACAIAGTWLGFSFVVSYIWLIISFVLFFCLSIISALVRAKYSSSKFTTSIFSIIIAVTVFLGFWLSAFYHLQKSDLSLLNSVSDKDAATVSVVGSVAGDPFIYKNKYGYGWIWRFPLRLQSLKIDNTGVENNCSGTVTVKWYGPPPGDERIYGTGAGCGPEYGDRWQMTGHIRSTKYSRHGSNYILITGRRSSGRISAGLTSSMARQCLAARRYAADKLAVGIDDFSEEVALMRAILLGYRSDLRGEMRELFASVGTLHIFAISGLHVGIVCSLIIFILSVLTIPRTHWVLLLAPLLIAYTFATGARPSAVRACIMAIIYFGAPLVWRKADSISAVSLAVLLILAVAPQQLFEIGFLYSFIVVLGLIILFPIIHQALVVFMQKIALFKSGNVAVPLLFWEQDNFQTQDESKWIIKLRKMVHLIISLFALSCSAWLASVPITVYFFGRFSPIALIANVFVIPLAFLVVVTGALSLIFGSCITIMGDIFNHANMMIIKVLVKIMQIISKLPGAYFDVEKVPLYFVVIWYAVLLVIVYIYNKTKKSNFTNNSIV
jgi:ComEC/Rec2-related protein